MVEIIVYAYDFAPNPQKLFHFLAYFQIPYKYYRISSTLPRPDLSSIGIQYRRSPILSIDSDLYVDTALIIEKLSDIARHQADNDVDCTNHLEYDGFGQSMFRIATSLVPLTSPMLANEHFLADRRALLGMDRFSVALLRANRPQAVTDLLAHLDILERHFLNGGGKTYVMGEAVTTGDIYVFWSTNWALRFHDGARPEVSDSTHPITFAWLDRVETWLKGRRQDNDEKGPNTISWDQVKDVLLAPPTHEYAKFVPHDEDNPLGLKEGVKVSVTPTDSGKTHPQSGTLISLNKKQVCLRNDEGLVMHFPRLNYVVAAA